jgi:hypothetical protein
MGNTALIAGIVIIIIANFPAIIKKYKSYSNKKGNK